MRRAFYEGFKYVCGKYGVDPIPLFKAAATAAASTPAKSSPAAGAPKGTSAGAAPSAPRPAAPKPAAPAQAPADPFTVGGIEGYRLGRQGKTTSAPVVSKPPASPQTKTPAPVAKPVVKTPPASTGGVENLRRRWDEVYNQGKVSQNPNAMDPEALKANVRSNIDAYKRLTQSPFGTANPFEMHQAFTTGTGPYSGWADSASAASPAINRQTPQPQNPSQAAQPAQTAQKPPAPQAKPYHWQNANGRNFQTMDEAKFLEEWRKGTAQQRNKAMSSIGVNQKMWEQADEKQRMLWRRQAADSYYARSVRDAAARAARNANFGVHPNMTPSRNFYRPDPENPGFAVNAYGQKIQMNPVGSLLGNSPYAVAGWGDGRMELNGLFYAGQNDFAPGTTVLRQPRIGMA